MKEKLRTSNNRDEIINNLTNKLSSSKKITLWQKDNEGNRKHFSNLEFEQLYVEEGVFTIKSLPPFLKNLDPRKEVFILLEEHGYTFKTKVAVEQKLSATFQIPRELNLKEMRAYPRRYYHLEDKMYVEVMFSAKDRNNISTSIAITCPLINISQGGACIVISKETIKSINVEAGLMIKCTSEFSKAEIRNARLFSRQTLTKEEYFALGVEFSNPLLHSPI